MEELHYSNCELKFDEKRGKWRGRLYRWEDGKRKYRTKTLKATGKRAARQEFEQWRMLEEQELSRALADGRTSPLQKMTVPEYVLTVIDAKRKTGAIESSTVKGYECSLKHIQDAFEDMPLRELTAHDVSEWLGDLNARELSSSTTGKAFRLLKTALDDAVRKDVIPRNPASTVKAPKRGNKAQGINALDADARKSLIEKLNALDLSPVSVAVYIALYTGMRRGEICGLQWRDIEPENGVIWVRRSIGIGNGGTYLKQPKTDKGRDVAMPTTLAHILESWKAERRAYFAEKLSHLENDSFVIGDPLGYYNPTRLTKEFNSLIRLFGIKGTEGRYPVFHDLRHTWATVFLASGGDVKTAASNLGHANAAMTLNIYASADPDAKRRAAQLIEDAI